MKEYLNMSDVFAGKVKDGLTVNGPSIHGENHAFYGNMKDRDCAVYAAHAINSHDELVALVGDLVAALAIAKCALEDCYDVTEYPANGSSQCDKAIAVAEMAIYKAKGA